MKEQDKINQILKTIAHQKTVDLETVIQFHNIMDLETKIQFQKKVDMETVIRFHKTVMKMIQNQAQIINNLMEIDKMIMSLKIK